MTPHPIAMAALGTRLHLGGVWGVRRGREGLGEGKKSRKGKRGKRKGAKRVKRGGGGREKKEK